MKIEKKDFLIYFIPESGDEEERIRHLLPVSWDNNGEVVYFLSNADEEVEEILEEVAR